MWKWSRCSIPPSTEELVSQCCCYKYVHFNNSQFDPDYEARQKEEWGITLFNVLLSQVKN